jgi:cation-transporting ATPase 13A1
LLIRGSCVVNEAILTGESIPQIKETIANTDTSLSSITDKINLNYENNSDLPWRRHIVMGSTTILQHVSTIDITDKTISNTSEKEIVENPPDGGCLAVVLRTRFATIQVII